MSSVYYSPGLKVPWLGRTWSDHRHDSPDAGDLLHSDRAVGLALDGRSAVQPDAPLDRQPDAASKSEQMRAAFRALIEQLGADP